MTQISILSGIRTDAAANFEAAYPVNLEPVLTESGISKGFLCSWPGIRELASGMGPDRGAINWKGQCIRVIGTELLRLTGGGLSSVGYVGGSGFTPMDYSFDALAIASGGRLFYYDGSTTIEVTDPDLGLVLDVMWIDGYFMTTDGEFLVVTELSDPFAVDPLKYGSSETDPDPVVGLRKVRGEVYVLNRYTIENMQNVGGTGFPFRRNAGGMIPKGCVGTAAKCDFLESFAFIGGGRNEGISVYLAGPGRALPMSTPTIDKALQALSLAEQQAIQLEAIVDDNEQRLLVHLPDRTLIYFHQASRANESPVWAVLASGVMADEPYVGRNFVLDGARWICGSPEGEVGYLDPSIETQFGDVAGWQFDVGLVYNAAKGGIVRAMELVGAPGRAPMGSDPTAFLSFSFDGLTWTQERAIKMGQLGDRRKRMQWRPKMKFSNYVGARFRGANTAIASFAACEADIEPLRV